MRNLKKFLALVLAMMMTMSLMLTVNAATSSEDLNLTDSESVTGVFLEDIQVLTGMEVIKGYPDGSFKPQTEINRHQMATFIYRMTTGDTGDLKDRYLAEIAAEKFPDVKAEDSYAGYIGYCWVNGYIAGFPDGNGGFVFKPMNKVTGYQALVMILRAMGYNNPNDNFTGSDWQSLALSRARMNNLLVNIDKSVYSSTFSRPAPRELVAEMVFQGLIQPQVTYTPAMGYQKYGMEGGVLSNILNPTLGYENFGLTNHKGIVVGNQGSGETVTKVGFSLDVSTEKGINIGEQTGAAQDWIVTGSVTGANFNDTLATNAYYYDSKLYVKNGNMEGNVTLSFNWESDLTLFNHAVDVWYDYRGATTNTVSYTKPTTSNFNAGSVTFRDTLKTYAVFDRVDPENIKVATADWAYNNGGDADMDDVFGATADTLYNYAFAPMNILQDGANGTVYEYNLFGDGSTLATGAMPSHSAASPIVANNGLDTYDGTTADPASNNDAYPLYLAIDNTGNGAADVIISLNLTMTKVVQDNNTQAPLTTGVLSENDWTANGTADPGVTDDYFDLWDQKSPINATPDYSDIADDHLLNSDGTTLGKYVSAMTITGTAPGTNDGVDATPEEAAAEGNAKAIASINSTYYYQVNELKDYVTGTMVKYDQLTDKIWVTVGGELKEIERSVFALATDGSFQPHSHVFAPRPAGTYRFYLDEEGKWIFWEQDSATAEFVYGTYINYTTNEFGGLFNYPFVYVNAAGEKNQTGYVTRLDMNGQNGPLGTSYTGDMTNAGYTAVQLPKRTNTGDNSSGFVPGAYVGYTMTKNDKNEVTLDADVTATNFRQATTNTGDFGEATKTTTINSTSVALTAHPVTDSGNLFLTSRTKFIVVDGAGTETQKVDIYNGLAELLGDNLSVEIDATTGLTNGGSFLNTALDEVGTNPWKMVYYSTEEDPYSQNYYQMDRHIATVFIPKQLITWTANPASGNLWFVGDNTHGLIDAGTDATQFTFHQGTETKVLWIAGQYGGTNARAVGNANVVGDQTGPTTKDTFYWLFDTGAKARDGEPIYSINTVGTTPASPGAGLIGYYYAGTDVTDPANPIAGARTAASKTAITLGDSAGTTYLATTRNSQVAYIGGRAANTDLYNVQNATIKNLNKAYTINSLGDLNEASSNASNNGVAVSCVLNGDSATFVDHIYVNFVPGT